MGCRLLVLPAALLCVALAVFPGRVDAAPSCADGPETVGSTIVGTPCADVIRLPRAVTTARGEGGDDRLYGQRGNDNLFGGEGSDRLFGGIGDDRLRGGPGDDLLYGGFGADSLDGEGDDDLARGDATIDAIGDSGGGEDTLSFATGATPGFPNSGSFFTDAGFPTGATGRGVYVDLDQGFANNGLAPSGGGVDGPLEPGGDFGDFETVIGTAFPDYIVGTAEAETFYGAGGADLIDGNGGGDTAHGGADGDGCVGVAVEDCELNDEEIDLRDEGAIAAGAMAPGLGGPAGLYLVGSDQDDRVTASFTPNVATPDPDDGVAAFSLATDSEGQFDTDPGAGGGCTPPSGDTIACSLPEPPDSILLAGMEGADILLAPGFPETVAVVLLGNEDADDLSGGNTEDALVDGAGNDDALAGGRDDALPNNGGADQLDAGPGEDLFVSNAVCDGDVLDGGPDRDNANWANFNAGVAIDMAREAAGLIGPQGEARCGSAAQLTTLRAMEDIEGTDLADNLFGDAGPNQLLGWGGSDNYLSGAGNDHLLVNSGDSDGTVDCGEGFDTALIDFTSAHVDGPPVGCESVEQRNPNSFRPPDTPPDPDPEPAEETPPPIPSPGPPQLSTPAPPANADRKPPATRIGRHPPALLFAAERYRRVAFTFNASEQGTRFRCRLDRRAFRPCRSPRAYRTSLGRHTFRVFAIDAAGNRDPSPTLFRFRVRSFPGFR